MTSEEAKIKVSDFFGDQGGAGDIGRRIASYDRNGGKNSHEVLYIPLHGLQSLGRSSIMISTVDVTVTLMSTDRFPCRVLCG